jgi:hypothetical protein
MSIYFYSIKTITYKNTLENKEKPLKLLVREVLRCRDVSMILSDESIHILQDNVPNQHGVLRHSLYNNFLRLNQFN